jgi:hypothetical protein
MTPLSERKGSGKMLIWTEGTAKAKATA